MRGRTNITQRSGTVPVNGDIIEAEVMSEKIDIGDFVRYGVIESSKEIFGFSSKIKQYREFMNDYYLCISNDSLYLLKKNENGVESISVYNDYTIRAYTVLDDNSIVCSINESPYVIRIKIENENFVFINSSSNGVKVNSNYCFYYEGYVFIVYSVSGFVSFYIYEVSDVYEINYISSLDKQININTYGDEGFGFIFENGKFIHLKRANNINSTYYVCLVKIEINIIGGEIVYNTSTLKTSYNNTGGYGEPVLFFGKYYVMFAQWISGYYSYNKIIVFNINSLSKVEINPETLGLVGERDTASFLQSLIFNNRYLCIAVNNKVCIFEMDENSGSLFLISNILENIFSNPLNVTGNKGCIFVYNNIINVLIPYNSKTTNYILELIDNNVYKKSDKNVVYRWEESYNSIGFAKTGGTSGETIQVYVPKSN